MLQWNEPTAKRNGKVRNRRVRTHVHMLCQNPYWNQRVQTCDVLMCITECKEKRGKRACGLGATDFGRLAPLATDFPAVASLLGNAAVPFCMAGLGFLVEPAIVLGALVLFFVVHRAHSIRINGWCNRG